MSTDLIKSFYQKKAKVSEKLRWIKQTGKNEFHGYKYTSGHYLFGELGDACRECGLDFSISDQFSVDRMEHTDAKGKVIFSCIIKVAFCVTDLDTGYQVTGSGFGEGQANDDKSLNKALTSARKNAILGYFNVAQGDDPEAEDVGNSYQPAKSSRPPSIRKLSEYDSLASMKNDFCRVFGIKADDYRSKVMEILGLDPATDPVSVNINRAYVEKLYEEMKGKV